MDRLIGAIDLLVVFFFLIGLEIISFFRRKLMVYCVLSIENNNNNMVLS